MLSGMRFSSIAVVVVVAAALWGAPTVRSFVGTGAQEDAARAAVDCATITASNSDDCIRLNQIQVLGTHNSYHIAPEPQLLAALGANARDIDYSHRPLAEQLSRGIRKLSSTSSPIRMADATPRRRHCGW
jgi:hypothetical protein